MEGLTVGLVFWYVFPVILLFASSFLISTFSLKERYRLKAPDVALPFMFIGVHALSMATYKASVIPYLLIVYVLLAAEVAVYQAYYYGDIQYKRFFKMFWRIAFIIMLFVYILFIVLNIMSLKE